MIQLTEAAAGKVRNLGSGARRALRVKVRPGGCSGLRYEMYLDDVAEGDATEKQHGVRVVVDRMSGPYVADAWIDFVDTTLVIRNPRARSTCACGHSFQ